MKNKICTILLIMIISLLTLFEVYSKFNVNNRKIEKRLKDVSAYRLGKVKDIFNIDYDKVYSITSVKNKQEIEDYIKVKNRHIKDNKKGETSIIFMKNKKIVAYLHGDKENNGYYISIQEGEFLREYIENKNFTSKVIKNYMYYSIDD